VSTGGRPRRDAWVDAAGAVLMALATVATAWSGYQASRWNGEQATTAGRANAARIESTRASGLADAQTQIDVATFTQWVDAYARGEEELAAFYRRRFRPEFAPAAAAWAETQPLRNRDAPLTPFAMPEYRLAARDEADALEARADALSAQVRVDVQRATNYVLAVVLFATVLFFAGMSARLGAPRIRIALLAMGAAVFVGTVVWIATSPVSLSI
jgi:hypothetical protein